MSCNDFKQKAIDRKFNPALDVLIPTDPEYNTKRIICNTRFDWHPCAIAFCLNEEHIAFCLQYCRDNGRPFRIRSGGHQHEGMCSGNDVLLIDVSRMNGAIQFLPDNKALIQVGKQLGDRRMDKTVYKEVADKGLIFAGGGCESVFIGGLLQGGGWGPASRMYGLTCDSLVEATVVLANGKTVAARKDNEHSDLFWALQGGGGGNMGVVTQYQVQLYPTTETWLFTINWSRTKMEAVTTAWIKMFTGGEKSLPPQCYADQTTGELVHTITCGLRLVVVPDDNTDAAILTGSFYGTEADLTVLLGPLLAITYRSKNIWLSTTTPNSPGQPQPQTCDAKPHAHKISSCFPIDIGNWDHLTERLTDFIKNKSVFSTVFHKYVNLQSMGGKISWSPPQLTAFYYRTKPFLLQLQAWCFDEQQKDDPSYVAWIADFREYLVLKDMGIEVPLIEGALINFPDQHMDKGLDIKTNAGKLQLLRNYYVDNLDQLRTIKTKYDPRNLFSFEMSIPILNNISFAAGLVSNLKNTRMQVVFMTNIEGYICANSLINGTWDTGFAARIPTNAPVPVVQQFATCPHEASLNMLYYILDVKGKLWQFNWNYINNTAQVQSLDAIFYSSPDKFDYKLKWFSFAYIRSGTQMLFFMVTEAGRLWLLNYFDGKSLGAVAVFSNLPGNLVMTQTRTNALGNFIHVLVLDAAGVLWYMVQPQDEYHWFNLVFIEVLKSIRGNTLKGARHFDCSTDKQNTLYIVVIDNVSGDLWYFQQLQNGHWDYLPVNIQDEIRRANPSFSRINEFVSISVSYDTDANELHIYAMAIDNNIIYHTVGRGTNWKVFDVVPN